MAGALPRRASRGAGVSFPMAPMARRRPGSLLAPASIRACQSAGRPAGHRQQPPAGRARGRAAARRRRLRPRRARAPAARGLRRWATRPTCRRVFRAALDDRALFIAAGASARWPRSTSAPSPATRSAPNFRRLLKDSWDGRASVGSSGYRLARSSAGRCTSCCSPAPTRDGDALDPKASMAMATSRWPAVLARLLDERPAAWLPAGLCELAGRCSWPRSTAPSSN
jgi:penicillin amidase